MQSQYASTSQGAGQRQNEWLWTTDEKRRAGNAIGYTFVATLGAILVSGVATLVNAPTSDAAFGAMAGANCLRVARRADYAVVFLDMGTPLQRLKVLVDLGAVQSPGGEALSIFSPRMHKSESMRCKDLDPARPYAQACEDVVLVMADGSAQQSLSHTRFVFQNDQAAYSESNQAYLAGLDGVLTLLADSTYWVTTTHFCFAPLAAPLPPAATQGNDATLPFTSEDGRLVATGGAISAFDEALAPDTLCDDALRDAPVRLFPLEAANEMAVWLGLSSAFLYEHGSDVLEKRRRVVEAGKDCSRLVPELEHVRDLYDSDCGLGLGVCTYSPSLPFRRLATRRMRLDVGALVARPGGTFVANGTLVAEHTDALSNIASLKAYSEALNSALARLVVLLLMAAVVFIRGSQNATSPRWLLTHTMDTLLCRNKFAHGVTPQTVVLDHDRFEVVADALISIFAWVARVVVLHYSIKTLVADSHGEVVGFQIAGVTASAVHFLLRYCLRMNLKREAPISKLGGPMSVVDVTSAVLLLFSNSPLLSADDGRFDAIGRLLISVLVAIAVFTRVCFSAAMVASMAVSARNGGRRELHSHQGCLVVATLLWILQGVASAGSIALLFVNPAAMQVGRSQTGPIAGIKYAIFTGLLCTALPTFTKASLLVFLHERGQKDS
jgi:hypothetical protein